MLFSELAGAELEPHLKPMIDRLLELKLSTREIGEGRRIDGLNAYIEEMLVRLKAEIDALPREQEQSWTPLNELFIDIAGTVHAR